VERFNLIVIGAGSGGLVVAAGAAGLGARVALVEKHKMGGDCLNYGCVPSKALLRAAKAAQEAREAHRFGIRGVADPGPQDAKAVMDWVRAAQAKIAPHDSVERFAGLGVEVFLGAGRLRSAHEVEVEGKTLWGRHVVIATGSRAFIPDTPGLKEAGFLTNETIFDVEALPEHLVVFGGGPIGCELGQAFRRLGSRVTILSSRDHIVPKEDPDVAAVLAKRLRGEGIEILDRAKADRVELRDGKKIVHVAGRAIACDAILVSAGRRAVVQGLGLEAAGVAHDERGITIDANCRTSVPNVWAVGDVAGPYQFTHWAGHQARVVIQNILFPVKARFDADNLPWTTFTDPEIAHVGLSETDAKRRNVEHVVVSSDFGHNDRAICDGTDADHFAKVIATPKGKILGATIVHPHAGDLLAELVLAKKHGLSLSKLSGTIHAYPTLSEIGRALGDAWRRTTLTPGTKAKLTRVYAWLRR
jgi:pyruvate/2-oxoglutarate dehydrogenase complex dihydrolipoamide dehydrogenase (E3) component